MADKKGPATLSAQAEVMLPYWKQQDAVLGGTRTMREKGKTYMPPHTGEDRERYKERLTLATLWNQLELTLNGWVGRPFRDGLKLGDDVDPRIVALRNDIDRQGTNIDTFAKKWFRVGLSKAFCHVLIENPAPILPTDGSKMTQQDAEDQDIRPYWVLIEPDQVIAAKVKIIGGKETYTHVRILETTQEPDPENPVFGQVLVKKIRVYDRVEQAAGDDKVFVTMYREGELGEWTKESMVEVDVSFIPMLTYYSDRQGFLLGKSPLQDLSDLNIKHWQEQADQDSIQRVARFPILAGAGVEDLDGADPKGANSKGAGMMSSDGVAIGPYTFLVSEDSNAKFYYVEHTGKAIKSGQDSLDKLEEKMAAYGSEFLKKSPDRQTATARTLDSAESISPLQGFTHDFIDVMESALVMTAQWMGIDTVEDPETHEQYAGEVILVTEFGPEEVSRDDLIMLSTSQKERVISSKNLRREMVRRGVLRDNFDEAENKRELSAEALDMEQTQLPAATSDLDPLKKPEPKPTE